METETNRFLICLPFTLAQECPDPANWSNAKNFSNDPGDPGGATMCGITHREYDAWRKSYGFPTRPVNKCTESEGQVIYRASYWLPYCQVLPVGLDLEFFDASVNEGTTEAVRILQVALGLTNDGEWGRMTDEAVRGLFAPHVQVGTTIKLFTARRDEVYRQTKNFALFGKDWERRTKEIGAAALKMATERAT